MEQTYDNSKTFEENYRYVLKQEAKLFYSLNTIKKKLTKVDELRAEVITGDPLAVEIESIMKQLDLVCDRFGSSSKTAREVKSFAQFYYVITADYNDDKNQLQQIIRSTTVSYTHLTLPTIYSV